MSFGEGKLESFAKISFFVGTFNSPPPKDDFFQEKKWANMKKSSVSTSGTSEGRMTLARRRLTDCTGGLG